MCSTTTVVELTMKMDKIIVNLSVKPDNVKKVIDVLYNEPVINRKKLCKNTKGRKVVLTYRLHILNDKISRVNKRTKI